MNRSKKAILNLISQFVLQFATAICGFIVPRFILEAFGSDVNGLTVSITQFLGIVTLLDTSFGSVAKTAFYKPLALGDRQAISGVYNATESFFRKIALFFGLYCVILSFTFPFINESGFDFWFTAALVLILGISSFTQYYFSMSYTLALNADQLSFISAFMQAGTVVLNAVLTVILLKFGAGIHVVKLASASVFVIRPIVINLYGKHRYRVDKKIPKDNKSLSQKWDNMAQGIASYLHTKTAYILLTAFLTFRDVSVYSVYSLITSSLTSIISSTSTGFVAGLGNMHAKGEKENFHKVFSLYEFVNTFATFALFGIAIVTMMPFVKIYTANVTDVDYHKPLFGMILILGELIYCLRLPYHYVIANAGHFKQTKKGAYLEAIINVIVSICLLPFLGIVGLAIGTLVAMAFRTTELIIYCSKNITKLNALSVLKRIIINFSSAFVAVFVGNLIHYEVSDFVEWISYASLVSIITFIIMLLFNAIFYKDDVKIMISKMKNVFKKSCSK